MQSPPGPFLLTLPRSPALCPPLHCGRRRLNSHPPLPRMDSLSGTFGSPEPGQPHPLRCEGLLQGHVKRALSQNCHTGLWCLLAWEPFSTLRQGSARTPENTATPHLITGFSRQIPKAVPNNKFLRTLLGTPLDRE